jgi:cell division septation protein DedD
MIMAPILVFFAGRQIMFAKFGFTLLVLLFGALAFTGGMMAPDNWRAPVTAFGNRLLSIKPAATLPSPTAKAPPTSHAAVAATAAAPLNIDSLLVTTEVGAAAPAAGQPAYALQLGQFVTDDEATQAEQQAQAIGLPLTHLQVIDADKAPWTVLAAGRFATQAEAQNAAVRVQAMLKLASIPVIRLPAPAKSAT